MTDGSSPPPSEPTSFPALSAATRRFTFGAPRGFSVTADGEAVLFLRSSSATDAVNSLWFLDVATGSERTIADPRQIAAIEADAGSDGSAVPAAEQARRERAREASSGIVTYATDSSGYLATFALDGRLYVVDARDADSVPRQLAANEPPAIFDPRLSPDGSNVAFVVEGTLKVVTTGLGDGPHGSPPDRQSAASSQPTQIAPWSPRDLQPDVSWGVAEFVAAEEMGRTRGHWWSPDSQRLLFTRVDEAAVETWHLSDPALPEQPPRPIRYPAAGTANAEVSLWHVDVGERAAADEPAAPAHAGVLPKAPVGNGTASSASHPTPRQVSWPSEQLPYLVDIRWQQEQPPELVVQSRDQRTVQLLTVDTETTAQQPKAQLEALPAFEQRDPVWVELVAGLPRVTPLGVLAAGFPQSTDGQAPSGDTKRALLLDGTPITPPDQSVRAVLDVAEFGSDELRIVYAASTDPTATVVFSVIVANGGTAAMPIPLSDSAGVATAAVGKGTVVLTQARLTEPTTYAVSRMLNGADGTPPNGQPPNTTAGASAASTEVPSHRVTSHAAVPPVTPRVELLLAGANQVRTSVLWPSAPATDQPLPILLDPYGGPHAQRVVASRSAFNESQWFADRGFCVVVADGRGTPGRDRHWETAVAGDLLTLAVEDQLAALDAVVAKYPSAVDPTRVAIRGWSFGGYLAAGAAMLRPDRIHAAIAGAPVTDWRLYDTHYTERYLGHPSTQPASYDRSSLFTYASSLRRPLLLIHGFSDDNVVAAHTMKLSAALLAAGRPHEVLPLSGATHMATAPEIAEHLTSHQLDFLRRSLGLAGT